jgi:hypothetical protein
MEDKAVSAPCSTNCLLPIRQQQEIVATFPEKGKTLKESHFVR